jgi:hypothetical protein
MSDAAERTRTPGTAPGRRPLPLFYSKPAPLSPETFKGKSLSRAAKLNFARKTNSVPLNAAEFAPAQRFYPIVFTLEESPFPLAILGIRTDANLFVETDGRWRSDAYVPAYVRRYPFVLINGPGEKQFTLAADAASDLIVKGSSNPFFKDEKPTDVVNSALRFCTAFQSEFEKTRQFCSALAEQGIFEAKNAEITLPNGKKAVLGPFKIIDRAKFAALPDHIIADWHKRDWAGYVHSHFLSLANWAHLAKRATK